MLVSVALSGSALEVLWVAKPATPIVWSLVTPAFIVIAPPLSSDSDWPAEEPMVNEAAPTSNTIALIVTPPPRTTSVLPLPALLKVAVSPVPGTMAGSVTQLVLVAQALAGLAVPGVVARRSRCALSRSVSRPGPPCGAGQGGGARRLL